MDAQRTVYRAGQTSGDAEGRPLHAGDVEAQFNCALDAFVQAEPKVGDRLQAVGQY